MDKNTVTLGIEATTTTITPSKPVDSRPGLGRGGRPEQQKAERREGNTTNHGDGCPSAVAHSWLSTSRLVSFCPLNVILEQVAERLAEAFLSVKLRVKEN